jgi:protein-tyrosine-phosphatase
MTSKTEKFSIQEVFRIMTIQNENKHKPLPKQKSEKKKHILKSVNNLDHIKDPTYTKSDQKHFN